MVSGENPGRHLFGMVMKQSSPKLIICPKCGKPAWAPYLMTVTKKYGQVYSYQVYRHPDGRRRTPRKCTIRVASPEIEVKDDSSILT